MTEQQELVMQGGVPEEKPVEGHCWFWRMETALGREITIPLEMGMGINVGSVQVL